MTAIQGSLGEIDAMGPPRPCAADPLANLLAFRQARRDQPPRVDFRHLAQWDVVPRLCVRFSGLLPPAEREAAYDPRGDCRDEMAGFLDQLLANDHAAAAGCVEALLAGGRALDHVFLNLLAPAAKRLDELWRDDRCGLAEVTLAMHHLTGVLRHFAPAFRSKAAPGGQTWNRRQYRALLMTAPGAKIGAGAELFGLALASEFSRRDGWEASVERGLCARAMGDAVRKDWFDTVIIGSCERHHLDAVAAGIRSIRRVTRNRNLCVILHGRILVENPELPRQVDADYVSQDTQTSLIQAKQYMTLPPRRARAR